MDKPSESVRSPGVSQRRELDYFNVVGCLLVMLIHVLSPGITGLDRSGWQFALIFFPWQLAAYVVPAFLFAGAVKMSLGFERGGGYFKYILRRFVKIYVPYLIFTLVYYAVFLAINYVPGFSVRDLALYILRGNLSSPFYYVIIVMQFYLLMPLWRWAVRRIPWYLGLPASLFVTLLMNKASVVIGVFGLSFDYFDRVFPTYLVFWAAGLYAGANYDAVRRAVAERKTLWGLVMCGAFAFLSYLQYSRQLYLYDLGYLKPLSDLAMIGAVLCLSARLAQSTLLRTKRLLAAIHRASFTVYLSHALFLTLVSLLLDRAGVTDLALQLPIRALTCLTLPFALHWALTALKKLFKSRAA